MTTQNLKRNIVLKRAISAIALLVVAMPMAAQAWVEQETHAEFFRKDKELMERGAFANPNSSNYVIETAPPVRRRNVAPRVVAPYEVAPSTNSKIKNRRPKRDDSIEPDMIEATAPAPARSSRNKGQATLAEVLPTAAPAAATVKPQVAKENCPTPTVATGADRTASAIKDIRATLEKIETKPAAAKVVQVSTVKFAKDDEFEEYVEGEIVAQQKPIDITPVDESHRQKPKSSFVKQLLKYAEIEARKQCRSTSNGMRCRSGAKGMCLQGVRMAFQKASGQSTAAGWTLNAKDAGPHVRKYGYKKLALSDASKAPPGSVFIYRNSANPRHAGHIAIKGENGFYADYYDKYQINDPRARPYLPTRKLVEVWVPGK